MSLQEFNQQDLELIRQKAFLLFNTVRNINLLGYEKVDRSFDIWNEIISQIYSITPDDRKRCFLVNYARQIVNDRFNY